MPRGTCIWGEGGEGSDREGRDKGEDELGFLPAIRHMLGVSAPRCIFVWEIGRWFEVEVCWTEPEVEVSDGEK